MDLSLPPILPAISDPDLRFHKYLNFLLSLLARQERATKVFPLPFELTVDLSSRCQLSCPYCSLGNKTIRRPPGLFGPEQHDKVMRELGKTAFIIWYFSTGEPLLNRQAAGFFRAAREYEIFSVISTNLSFPLSDERIDDLLGSGLSAICVSLDGTTPESYSRYRVGGDFDLVVKNLVRLVRRKRKLGLSSPLIEWRFLVFRHNQGELQQAKVMSERLGVDLLEFYPGYAPSQAGEADVRECVPGTVIPMTGGPALRRPRRDTFLHRKLGMEVVQGISADRVLRNRKCDWLYFGTAAFPGGSVGPCCVSNDEPDDFGRLDGSNGFKDIWNNERYRAARGIFLGHPDPGIVCTRCHNHDAHDFQFRNTLSALLRNAPDWVIGILSQAPDRFFPEIDKVLLSHEMAVLGGPLSGLRPEAGDIERLGRVRPDDDWACRQVELLDTLLKSSVESCGERDRQARSNIDVLTERIRGASTDESAEILYRKVQEIIGEGRPGEAVILLENLIASRGGKPHWLNDLGCLHYDLGDMPKARDCFEKAVRIDSAFTVALKNLAKVYATVEGRTDEAIGLYRHVLDMSPGDAEALDAMTALCERTGRTEVAVPYLRRMLEVRKGRSEGGAKSRQSTLASRQVEKLLALGEEQFAQGNIPSAIGTFRRILEIDGNNSQALNNLGVIQWQLGDAASAMETFQIALCFNHNDMDALANLTKVAAGTGKFDLLNPGLLDVLRQAQPANPDIAMLIDGSQGNA